MSAWHVFVVEKDPKQISPNMTTVIMAAIKISVTYPWRILTGQFDNPGNTHCKGTLI